MKKLNKYPRPVLLALLLCALCCAPAFAAASTPGVADVVEQTWQDAAGQIKTVVNNVVFPALDMILAIAFFCKLGMAAPFLLYNNHRALIAYIIAKEQISNGKL